MKIRRKTSELAPRIELNMTPMIDCVFQLLSFFIMSLKFVVPEGDFDIRMPATAPQLAMPSDQLTPPIGVRLEADDRGRLKTILLNGQPVASFADLRKRIAALVAPQERGPGAAPEGTQVELDFDYALRYEYVISAITHVSGYIGDDGSIVRLIEQIKFKPPKK